MYIPQDFETIDLFSWSIISDANRFLDEAEYHALLKALNSSRTIGTKYIGEITEDNRYLMFSVKHRQVCVQIPIAKKDFTTLQQWKEYIDELIETFSPEAVLGHWSYGQEEYRGPQRLNHYADITPEEIEDLYALKAWLEEVRKRQARALDEQRERNLVQSLVDKGYTVIKNV